MKTKPPIANHSEDAIALRDLIASLIEGYGRGGLTFVAQRLNVTPSMLRKRLAKIDGGFDHATFAAIMLVTALKSENMEPYPIDSTKKVGPYRIDKRTAAGETIPTWSVNGE